MNKFANTTSALLKTVYQGKGPISQMNDNSSMLSALRKKRDSLKTK